MGGASRIWTRTPNGAAVMLSVSREKTYQTGYPHKKTHPHGGPFCTLFKGNQQDIVGPPMYSGGYFELYPLRFGCGNLHVSSKLEQIRFQREVHFWACKSGLSQKLLDLWMFQLGPPVEGLEVRVRVPFLSVVYFRGPLPTKKGGQRALGDLANVPLWEARVGSFCAPLDSPALQASTDKPARARLQLASH